MRNTNKKNMIRPTGVLIRKKVNRPPDILPLIDFYKSSFVTLYKNQSTIWTRVARAIAGAQIVDWNTGFLAFFIFKLSMSYSFSWRGVLKIMGTCAGVASLLFFPILWVFAINSIYNEIFNFYEVKIWPQIKFFAPNKKKEMVS